jgi:COMPASS component SWD3
MMASKPQLLTVITAMTLAASTMVNVLDIHPVIAENQVKTTNNSKAILTLSGHTAPVRTVAISPDGQSLASGGDDKTIRLWNLKTGQLLRTITGHPDGIKSLVFSPDGKILVSSGDAGNVRVWNVQTGQLIRSLTGHAASVSSIVMSPDGQTLATASMDKTIRLWNLNNGQLRHTIKTDANYLVMSPDGKTLFSGNQDGTIKQWNLRTRRLVTNIVPPKPKNPMFDFQRASGVVSLAISPDGQTIINGGYNDSHQSIQATDGKNVKVWNLNNRRLIYNFSVGIGAVESVVISPDGQNFIIGGFSHDISIFNLKTGNLIRKIQGHAGGVYALAISQDGKTLVSGSGDKSIKVWRL